MIRRWKSVRSTKSTCKSSLSATGKAPGLLPRRIDKTKPALNEIKGQGKHPLEIRPSASEKRNRQSKYEIFNPIPVSIAFVAATSQGKSSQMTTVANLLQPVMERTILISHSHKFDPAWQELKDKLHQKAVSRGEHTPCGNAGPPGRPRADLDHG